MKLRPGREGRKGREEVRKENGKKGRRKGGRKRGRKGERKEGREGLTWVFVCVKLIRAGKEERKKGREGEGLQGAQDNLVFTSVRPPLV